MRTMGYSYLCKIEPDFYLFFGRIFIVRLLNLQRLAGYKERYCCYLQATIFSTLFIRSDTVLFQNKITKLKPKTEIYMYEKLHVVWQGPQTGSGFVSVHKIKTKIIRLSRYLCLLNKYYDY